MSVKEMDTAQKLVLKSDKCEPEHFKNSSHKDGVFEVLQSSRNQDDNFCDIKLQTDDGILVFGHKNILASATPYFKVMFSSVAESNKDLVNIGELDSTILQLLIDYIYTGEIMITQENVQVVLPAADLFQLDFVKQACVEFLQKHLNPSNCLGIKVFADLYRCTELLSSCEAYIKKQFLEVVEHDEFLSLSAEEVIKLISCNDINVPFEEKVFECVIKWVKHELDHRKEFLPNLMEHVRLPLISKEYFSEKVVDEPLLNNNSKCKDYVFEALRFSIIKSTNPSSIPQTIWSKPRLQQQVILVLGWSQSAEMSITNLYDPETNLIHIAPDINGSYCRPGLSVIKDQFVFIMGGIDYSYGYTNNSKSSVEMLDVSSSSKCWVPKVDMLVCRSSFGVGVLDNCIYAIGGQDINGYSISSVEVYNFSTEQWNLVSNMSNDRCYFGVGVLHNLIYAVGGDNGESYLKSVECYNPSLDKWNPVAEMSISRYNVSVGVLDGIMYAIGGINGSISLKSVEAYNPIAGIWSSIADMHLCRENPGVVAFGGFLYVIGGTCRSGALDSVEIYNPRTNSWSMKKISISHEIYGAVLINSPLHLQTN